MKRTSVVDRPGLIQLKNDIEKNKRMVRHAAPITVENKGMSELEAVGEALYQKAQTKKRRARRGLLSRVLLP